MGDTRGYLRRKLELQDRDQVADAILPQAPGRCLPVAIDGCKGAPEPTCVTARQVKKRTPQTESFFGLPWPQAGVLKPGNDSTAMR